jgi:hypothetical protein
VRCGKGIVLSFRRFRRFRRFSGFRKFSSPSLNPLNLLNSLNPLNPHSISPNHWTMKIKGTVKYIALGTGFWGIIDEKGNEWRPVNMPEQLKKESKSVAVTIREVDDMSIFMWGTAVEIVTFNT